MKEINALGDVCPVPVVKTKAALAEMDAGTLQILVDNDIAAENIKRLAVSLGCKFASEMEDAGRYRVTLEKTGSRPERESDSAKAESQGETVVVIPGDVMGAGDEVLGRQLLKGFVYALTQLDDLPEKILLYNGGVFLSIEGSQSLEDLQTLERAGVAVMTCGACLNHYNIVDMLRVGMVTNMYAIVEAMNKAERILRP